MSFSVVVSVMRKLAVAPMPHTSDVLSTLAEVAARESEFVQETLDAEAAVAAAKRLAATASRPVVLAASTHPGEEDILLETHRLLAAFFPSLLTVIVPRHPDRGEAIAAMVAASGLHAGLRSREELITL